VVLHLLCGESLENLFRDGVEVHLLTFGSINPEKETPYNSSMSRSWAAPRLTHPDAFRSFDTTKPAGCPVRAKVLRLGATRVLDADDDRVGAPSLCLLQETRSVSGTS